MRIWRISNHSDLSGIGGNYTAGRWNHLGKEIVYCSDHPSTSLLEMLVRFDPDITPRNYKVLAIELSEPKMVVEAKLSDEWQSDMNWTRDYWDRFCKAKKAPVLKVPSAIMPQAHNFLLNPNHPDHASIKIVEVHENMLDERFYR